MDIYSVYGVVAQSITTPKELQDIDGMHRLAQVVNIQIHTEDVKLAATTVQTMTQIAAKRPIIRQDFDVGQLLSVQV